MYRFREIDISGVGPFGENNVLRFNDGFNLISATSGLGKTTIVRGLRGDFPNVRPVCVGQLSPSIPDWLIYFDDSMRCDLPTHGQLGNALTDFLEASGGPALDQHQLEQTITSGVQQMLEAKVSFAWHVGLTFGEDGRRALATDECVVLWLAIIKAIRVQSAADLDVPFVIDSGLAPLGVYLQRGVHRFLESLAGQVILLDNSSLFSSLGATPNYEICHDPCSGKSKIAVCSEPS